jgi:hypothetical protein
LILPASALADFTPSLTLDQSAGTTAGSNPAIGFDETFTSHTGDGATSDSSALPPGLLGNENIAGGACLASSSPNPACQIGTGTLTLAGGGASPTTAYLVKPPNPADVAGLAFGSTTQIQVTGDVTFGASGEIVSFPNLAPTVTGYNVTFTNLRLPTSCPNPPANVTLTATSQAGVTATTTAPLNVTGCSGLPYNPTFTATETKDAKDKGATLLFTITQQANEAATKSIALKLPSGLGVNLSADVGCLLGTGAGCNVGTATATSPIVPDAALANGTVVLGGSASAPTITISFPAPFAITLVGDIDLGSGTVTFNNMPDVTLTSLNLTITGPNGQKAFTTTCQPSSSSGTFTSQAGGAKTVTGTVKFVNCPANPTAIGSFSGLAAGHPGLRFTVTHGKGAPDVSSVSIGLPGGLKFSPDGIVMTKTCMTQGGNKKCTTTTLTKGLGIKGATAKSVALKGGKLEIVLKKAVGKVTITLSGPVLTESASLQTKVKKHKVKTPLTVSLNVGDAKGTSTPVPLKATAH